MSRTARAAYDEARKRQLNQNDARRIRTKVQAARSNITRSGKRWPFELIQNAHDPGPRNLNGHVAVDFSWQGKVLKVAHDGKPFVVQELAALLSGGSSKEFDDPRVADLGLKRLEQALPYLYATCRHLGQVRIEGPERTTIFVPRTANELAANGFLFRLIEVEVRREEQDETPRYLTAVRIMCDRDARSALIVVLEQIDGQRRVVLPEEGFPRVFVTLPIAGTDFLPFNVVLDGHFTPQQERDGILMNDEEKGLVRTALSTLPALLQHAVESRWQDAHRLALLGVPSRTFSGETESGETAWWEQTIREIALATAKQPIIETEAGLLPAIASEGEKASFPVPAAEVGGDADLNFDAFHELAASVSGVYPVSKPVSQHWGEIASRWQGMGIPVERLGLEELAARVKGGCQVITDLPLNTDSFTWLADLLLLAADLPCQMSVKPSLQTCRPYVQPHVLQRIW